MCRRSEGANSNSNPKMASMIGPIELTLGLRLQILCKSTKSISKVVYISTGLLASRIL